MVSQAQLLKTCVAALLCLCLGACSIERWAVKSGRDSDAGQVDLSHATPTTIAALRALPAPARLPGDRRIPPTETTLYVVSATLRQYKIASDADYHLVLADADGATMIAEIPDPEDVPAQSPLAAGVKNARAEFDHRFAAMPFIFRTAQVPVCVTGIGFFDFHHGQRGIAPNGIELHPVLDIQFNPLSCPATGGAGGRPWAKIAY